MRSFIAGIAAVGLLSTNAAAAYRRPFGKRDDTLVPGSKPADAIPGTGGSTGSVVPIAATPPVVTPSALTSVAPPPNLAPDSWTPDQGCEKYVTVTAGQTCYDILERPCGWTLQDFYNANPSVDSDDCSNLQIGAAYCIGGHDHLWPGAKLPHQGCVGYYVAKDGDTCNSIAAAFPGLTVDDFRYFNKGVHEECDNLVINDAYCVAVKGRKNHYHGHGHGHGRGHHHGHDGGSPPVPLADDSDLTTPEVDDSPAAVPTDDSLSAPVDDDEDEDEDDEDDDDSADSLSAPIDDEEDVPEDDDTADPAELASRPAGQPDEDDGNPDWRESPEEDGEDCDDDDDDSSEPSHEHDGHDFPHGGDDDDCDEDEPPVPVSRI